MKKKHIPWVVILLVLFLDQLSKVLVKTNMTLGQSIPVLGDWFYLHFTENVGMAFGFELGFTYGKLALSLFRLAAIAGISWYIVRLTHRGATRGLIICLSLILAGAIGNVIDSAFYGMIFSASHFNQVAVFLPEGGGYAPFLHGKVVDMLYFPLINTAWPEWVPLVGGGRLVFFQPVFNLADAAITVGVFSLLIFQKRLFAFQTAGLQSPVPPENPEEEIPSEDPVEPTT